MLWAAAWAASAQIEGVHLAQGLTPAEMSVAWTSSATGSRVRFGKIKDNLNESVAATITEFHADKHRTWYISNATMTGLRSSATYYYQVGDGQNWSSIYHFRATTVLSTTTPEDPQLHVIFGDMGTSHAFSLCPACNSTEICDCSKNSSVVGLVSEIDKAEVIVHVGDFAYDFDSNNGTTGDNFMRNIEQVAAYIPYMVSHGNHENLGNNLARYTEHFRHMPTTSGRVHSANGEAPNNWFYSFDTGLVHYIAISTELPFTPLATVVPRMLEWLEGDLTRANANRDKVPEHGVDLFLNGHEHDYERNYPVYKNKTVQSNVNPTATIYIVTGAAGSHELHEPFTRPQPARSAFRSNSFGYSRVYVHNATHVRWQQVQTDPTLFPDSDYGRVIDDAWIVQNKHGPFSLSEHESRYEQQEQDRVLCPSTNGDNSNSSSGDSCAQQQSMDHWSPMLDRYMREHMREHVERGARALPSRAERLHQLPFFGSEAIAEFRHRYGENAWRGVEERCMTAFDAAFGGQGDGPLLWEDVREDGSSDGHWSADWRAAHS